MPRSANAGCAHTTTAITNRASRAGRMQSPFPAVYALTHESDHSRPSSGATEGLRDQESGIRDWDWALWEPLDAARSRGYNRHTDPVPGRGRTGTIMMNCRTLARALALTLFAGSTMLAHGHPTGARGGAVCRPGHSASAVRDVHAAERARSDPVAGSPAADRRGQYLVSRRAGQRGPGPHRLRAPVRAHDVPGLEARAAATRTSSCSKRAGAQRHQRHHRFRSHQLLRDACRRTSSSWRCGSSPIAWAICSTSSIRRRSPTSRTSSATSGGRASRTSRTASSTRRVFHDALSAGPSVLRQRHRLARRHPGGASSTTCSEFFKQYYAPNNASLAIVGDFDKAAGEAARREVLRPAEARARRCRRSRPTTPPITAERRAGGDGSRRAAARLHGVADAADLQAGRRRRRHRREHPRRRQVEPAVQEARSTRSRSRRTSGVAAVADPRFDVPDRGDGPAGPHRRGNRKGDQRGARRGSAATGPTRPEMERARNTIETQIIEGLETLGGFGGVADRLNSYNHYLGNPGYLPQDIHRYRAGHRRVGQGLRRQVAAERSPRGRAGGTRREEAGAGTALVAEHAERREADCGGKGCRTRYQRRRAVARASRRRGARRGRCRSRRPRRSGCRTD